jgi:hypothetical protein
MVPRPLPQPAAPKIQPLPLAAPQVSAKPVRTVSTVPTVPRIREPAQSANRTMRKIAVHLFLVLVCLSMASGVQKPQLRLFAGVQSPTQIKAIGKELKAWYVKTVILYEMAVKKLDRDDILDKMILDGLKKTTDRLDSFEKESNDIVEMILITDRLQSDMDSLMILVSPRNLGTRLPIIGSDLSGQIGDHLGIAQNLHYKVSNHRTALARWHKMVGGTPTY